MNFRLKIGRLSIVFSVKLAPTAQQRAGYAFENRYNRNLDRDLIRKGVSKTLS